MNYFQSSERQPYHLSVGAVVVNEKGQIGCHYFSDFSLKGERFTDFYILMRETLEPGEAIESALNRGLMEEFGADARLEHFLGSIKSISPWGSYEAEKTTLYFLCSLKLFDLARRKADDPEGSSEIQWRDADFLIDKMKGQRQRLGREDLDESSIVQRAKLILSD